MTPRTVATTTVAVLVGTTVLVLWGVETFVPLLLLALALTVLHLEVGPTSTPRRWPEDLPVRAAPPPVAPPDGSAAHLLAGCSDAELCRAWRVSHAQLQRHRGPEWAEHLAGLRRSYLDELERRDPDGFAAWIGSGARAGGDPARYLTSTPRTP